MRYTALRTFETRNLAQMKTVYPNAYQYRQEKSIQGTYDRREQYHLTVECNTTEDGSVEDLEGTTVERGGRAGHLTTTALIKRRKVFQRNLTRIVRKHHQVNHWSGGVVLLGFIPYS